MKSNFLSFSKHNARFQDEVACFAVFWLTKMFSLCCYSGKTPDFGFFLLLLLLYASHCLNKIYGLKENKSWISIIIEVQKIKSEDNYNNTKNLFQTERSTYGRVVIVSGKIRVPFLPLRWVTWFGKVVQSNFIQATGWELIQFNINSQTS